MLTADDIFVVNGRIIHSCLEGFAFVGYSGEISYVIDICDNIVRTRSELDVITERRMSEPEHALVDRYETLTRYWPSIEKWLAHHKTQLRVSFQRGKITQVKFIDRA